jgi:imidazolonepropionase-like amidohydrolase
LMLEAGLATGFGLSEEDALKSITINAAEILGVDDRVGSLVSGKDGDVLILNGPPLKMRTMVEKVYLEGRLVYEREEKLGW